MIIRRLQYIDRFAAMSLWQQVFADPLSFAAFYFAFRFEPTLSFGAFDGDTLVSMALGRPFPLQNPDMQGVMISGVCTLPTYRRQGLMTETVSHLLINAEWKGMDLALLSPAIPDLYRSFGFRPLTYAVKAQETAAGVSNLRKLLPIVNRKIPQAVYRRYCDSHPFSAVRTPRDFEVSIHEYSVENGFGLNMYDGSGYIYFLRYPDRVEVAECFADTPEQYGILLRGAAAFSPNGTAEAMLPLDSGLPGRLIRPVYALPLKESISIEQFAKLRSTYLFQLC